jgi:hypothetical protein
LMGLAQHHAIQTSLRMQFVQLRSLLAHRDVRHKALEIVPQRVV